jgi:hypothetical protein
VLRASAASNTICSCARYINEKHKDYKYSHELIQDDETFDASVVNIGLIGVVYSYVLRTVPGFCLKEERKVFKWGEGA